MLIRTVSWGLRESVFVSYYSIAQCWHFPWFLFSFRQVNFLYLKPRCVLKIYDLSYTYTSIPCYVRIAEVLMCLRFRNPEIVKLLRSNNHQILIKVVNMIIQTINLFINFFFKFQFRKKSFVNIQSFSLFLLLKWPKNSPERLAVLRNFVYTFWLLAS